MTRQMLSTVSRGSRPLCRSASSRIIEASRPGRKAEPESCGLLHRDQAVDDPAALHQQPVHRLVDAVDLAPQIGEGEKRSLFGHGVGYGKGSRGEPTLVAVCVRIACIIAAPAERKGEAKPPDRDGRPSRMLRAFRPWFGLQPAAGYATLRSVIRTIRPESGTSRDRSPWHSSRSDRAAQRGRPAVEPRGAFRRGPAADAGLRRRARALADRLPDLRHAQRRANATPC